MSLRGAIVFVTTAASIVVALAGIGVVGGIRLNLTPSEPLGIWRIEPGREPIVGDLVFICPPPTPQFEEAWQRGYLRRGL
jgi:type IV secretory pathway protease TraF